MTRPTHYLSSKLHAKPLPGEVFFGIFANTGIQPGELLAVWGGIIVNQVQLYTLDKLRQKHAIQVADFLYLAPIGAPEPADFFNHSCEPNAGLRGQIALVSLREIKPGEQVCFDYAMSDASDYDQFSCHCGNKTCRGQVTGQDWNDPVLWEKYAGSFSPYIQHKIDRIKVGEPADVPTGELVQGSPTNFTSPGHDSKIQATHYLSPLLEAGQTPQKGHNGVFAIQAVPAGALLTAWGGIVVSFSDLNTLEPYQREQAIQVEEGLHLAPFGPSEPADFFNHSCNPNAGLDGQNCLVALRDIFLGEEVCFDYATSDCTPYDEFNCQCGDPSCRRKITAEDWRRPELWEKYAGHFSPYLQRRIERLR